MTTAKIEITQHGMGRVWVDGRDVSNQVYAVSFSARAGEANVLRLDLNPCHVAIDAAETNVIEVTELSQMEVMERIERKLDLILQLVGQPEAFESK